jgi:hypothetical protein
MLTAFLRAKCAAKNVSFQDAASRSYPRFFAAYNGIILFAPPPVMQKMR